MLTLRRMYILVSVAVIALVGCSPIQHHVEMHQALDTVLTAGIGDEIARVEKTGDLPNVFGKADLYGRTRNEGFASIRFAGLTQDGKVVVRRTEVDVSTNETTMTNSPGFASATYGAHVSATPYSASGQASGGAFAMTPATANRTVLPPNTMDFVVDLSQTKEFVFEGFRIEIVGATPTELQYRVHR